jgi:phosphoinositide-3-kinase, regulatory subunit 4
MAVTWATQTKKGVFWQTAQEQRTFSFGTTSELLPKVAARDVQLNGFSRVYKNEEDENWIGKLKNLGMGPDDEWKVIALREYIWRMARSKPRLLAESTPSLLNNTISLQNLDITPQTIFFDENESFFNFATLQTDAPSNGGRPATIADALLDASRTIDAMPRRTPSRLQNKRPTGIDAVRSRLGADVSAPASPTMTSSETGSGSGVVAPLAVPIVTVNGSSESSTAASSVEYGAPLRRKPSTLSLLSRGAEASKAAAETSTVSATVFGKVENPFSRNTDADLSKGSEIAPEPEQFTFRAAHSYGWLPSLYHPTHG